VPVVRVKRKYQVTIPVEVRKRLGLAEGDYLEVTEQGDQIVLRLMAVMDKAAEQALKAFQSVLDRIREHDDVPEEEVERDVLEAIRSVREQARAHRRS